MSNDEKKSLEFKKTEQSSYDLRPLLLTGIVGGATVKAADVGVKYIGEKISDYKQKRSEYKEKEAERKAEEVANRVSEKLIDNLEKYFHEKSHTGDTGTE